MDVTLAGDIGGTHTRLALYDQVGTGDPLFLRVYASAQFDGLEAALRAFLAEARAAWPNARPVLAGFGVAGPADGVTATLTNLPWSVRPHEIARLLAIPRAVFVNDFAAICRAVPLLAAEHHLPIGGGTPVPEQPKAVLGAGTGLGMGLLAWTGSGYRVLPSEGGHAEFAPRGAVQRRLAQALAGGEGIVSAEDVLSGRGLASLYRFLRDGEGGQESPAASAVLASADPAATIARLGLAGDALCSRALDLFCEILGATAANLALLVLARGGVYLAGGIAGHLRERLLGGGFRRAFEEHRRYGDLLRSIPVWLITHPQPGLLGAALAARDAER
jgi:glucokinase